MNNNLHVLVNFSARARTQFALLALLAAFVCTPATLRAQTNNEKPGVTAQTVDGALLVAQGEPEAPSFVTIQVRSVRAWPGTGDKNLPASLEDLRGSFKPFPYERFELVGTYKEAVETNAQATFSLDGDVTMVVTVHEIKPNRAGMHVRLTRGAQTPFASDIRLGRDASVIVQGPEKDGAQIFYAVTVLYPAVGAQKPAK